MAEGTRVLFDDEELNRLGVYDVLCPARQNEPEEKVLATMCEGGSPLLHPIDVRCIEEGCWRVPDDSAADV
jgi:hypothetical protein